MDITRFDRLTKRLVSAGSRRSVLKGLIGGGAVAVAAVPVAALGAQEASPAVGTPAAGQDNWLLVVNFTGAEVVAGDGASTALTVTLSGVSDIVTAFTDRPERQVAVLDPDAVASSINSASVDPLNAALVARRPLRDEATQLVVLLKSASFDATAETLTLEIEDIGEAVLGTPAELDSAPTTTLRGGSLFIDNVILVESALERGSCSPAGEKCATLGPHCCSPSRCVKPPYTVYGICVP